MTTPADAPRPGSWLPAAEATDRATDRATARADDAAGRGAADVDPAARLAGVPVAGPVEVLTAEHERLPRVLATIDQL